MITVPSHEIAAFLENHLDHVLHRTGSNFLTSVAADREFKAGCAIMDVLNAVDSVQKCLQVLLAKRNPSKGGQTERQQMEVRVMSLYLLHTLYSYLPIQQNPFLCLFVDIYNSATQDERLKSERFVTSLILNGKGEELSPSTPSELIAIAQKVESKPVNIGLLEEYLPEVPIEDQVKVGLGWDQAGTHHSRKRQWHMFKLASRYYEDDSHGQETVNGDQQKDASGGNGHGSVTSNGTLNKGSEAQPEAHSSESEEELEEWEIEAEKRFQDSDDDSASPSLPAPASSTAGVEKTVAARKVMADKVKPIETAVPSSSLSSPTSRSKQNSPKEAASSSSPTTDQEQFKRRRKTWQRK